MAPRETRTYIRVHDGMPDHPKIDGLSDAAFRLLVTMWCWSSRHATDGRVPSSTWTKRGTPRSRRELVSSGLVMPVDGGMELHDYLDWQRSADEIVELREKRRKSGKAGGTARANELANARQVAKQTASKNVPYTENREELKPLAPDKPPRTRDDLFDALTAVCGINPVEITTSQRGSLNGSLKQLREVGATAEQVTARAGVYRQRFPDASLTPPALVKHWAACGGELRNGEAAFWRG